MAAAAAAATEAATVVRNCHQRLVAAEVAVVATPVSLN